MVWRTLQRLAVIFCMAGLLAACQSGNVGSADWPVSQGSGSGQPPRAINVPASDPDWQEVSQPQQSQSDLYAYFSSILGQAQRDKAKAAKDVQVKVGILVPLSGPHKDVGNALLHAAQLAVLDFAGDNFTLLSFDTGGTSQGAVEAFYKARDKGVEMILGPLFATEVEAVGRVANIPVVGFSNDANAAGQGTYIMGFRPEPQVARLVSYAVSQNRRNFAALAPDTVYGRTVIATLEKALRSYGGQLVKAEYYPENTREFSAVAQSIASYRARQDSLASERARIDARQQRGEISKAEAKRQKSQLEAEDSYNQVGYDALLIADSGPRLRALVPLLPYYDVDTSKVRLMGLNQWEDTAFSTTEPALTGSWFAGSEPGLRQRFEETFKKTWNYAPPRIASIAYDATALAAILARIDNGYPDFSRQTITAASGYEGIDGIFRFRSDGIVERGFAILQIQNRSVGVRDNAPRQF
jgi:ABC-type branched-subunit amino acid transport system substrate-binding protein